jgi:hypothetical protein
MLCDLLGLFCPQVDAFYYPNRSDLTEVIEFIDVGTIDECRRVVRAAASERGDPSLSRGDYECGVNPTGSNFGAMKVYEETVR